MSCTEERESQVHRRRELPRSHDAAGLARRFLDAHFADTLGEIAYTNARMIVSELVTNAFVHGEGRIHMGLQVNGDALRIEVVDEGTGEAPAIREQPDGGVGGWGLRIVDSISHRWGAFEGTTHVWAELPA